LLLDAVLRVLSALCISSALLASDPWPVEDKVLEGVFILAVAIDWKQTSDIGNHPELHERNRLMGRHPSHGAINTYFV